MAESDAKTGDESEAGTSIWKRSLRAAGGVATGALSATGDRASGAIRGAQTARAISDLESRVSAFRRERKIGKGTIRAIYVAAYRGTVSDGYGHMRVRVMEEPVIPDSAEHLTDPKALRANIRRFVALAFPGVKLQVQLAGNAADAVSDRHGFASVHIPAVDLEPGWHDYHVITKPDDPGERPRIATGEVLVPHPAAHFHVISDVDDTVIRTGLSEGFVAVKNTFMGRSDTRRPIPGVAALYDGLRRGVDADAEPAFFYVSTGPWNLYEVLTEFLEIRGFPKGVLFLTDWGPQERYVMRSGKEHKRLTLSRLFASYPNTRFIMIGDSGQADPDTYLAAARQFPSSVAAIVILDVGEHMAERATELKTWTAHLAKEGIAFNLVADAHEAARVLAERGFIEKDVIEKVNQEAAKEARA